MTKTWLLLLIFVVLALPEIIVYSQSVTGLRPPAQTYIYAFNGAVGGVVPAAAALNLGASFSIEFWMMISRDPRQSQYIRVFQRALPDGTTLYELDLDPITNQLTYSQTAGTNASFRGSQIGVALIPGQWYHVAVVSDNLRVTVYLNGAPQVSFTAAGPPPSTSFPLVLAAQAYGDGTGLCCGFSGSLRQFRIWGRALQPAEIATYATTLLSGSENGLIADWPLDDGEGTTGHDLGPGHLALTLKSFFQADLTPGWMRTTLVDGSPYFAVRKLPARQTTIQSPGRLSIPIDFDSDGKLDLVVCQGYKPTAQPCAALHNDGKANFTEVTATVFGSKPPSFESARNYAVADFNGDGRMDVFIANSGECYPPCGYNGGQSALLLQTPDGRLEDATVAAGLQQRIFTHDVAAADIDGDGDVDLLLVNLSSVGLPPQLYINDGHAHFTLAGANQLPAVIRKTGIDSPQTLSARFIDVNQDGAPDLFLGGNESAGRPKDWLLLNDGHGTFTLAPDAALPNRYGGQNWATVNINVVDFNHDGWPDLVNTVYGDFYYEGALQLLINNQDGTFRDATDLIVQPPWPRTDGCCTYLQSVFPADFNGDGFMDLFVEGSGVSPHFFLNSGPLGNGRLVDLSELLPFYQDEARAFAVADFDGNGLPDIVGWTVDYGGSNLTMESWFWLGKFSMTPDLIPALPTGPFVMRGNVFNSATLSADALVPGELVTILGRNLGPGVPVTASPNRGVFPTALSGTRVLFNKVAAPLISTSSGEVRTVVPFSAPSPSRADVVVEYNGQQSPTVSIPVSASSPGLFTADGSGIGNAAVYNVDAETRAVSLNSPQNPATRGGFIVAYITGGGQTDPPSIDGMLARPLGRLTLPVTAGLDFFGQSDCSPTTYCTPVEVMYAGPAAGMISGITQVNMRVPDASAAVGIHTLRISVGGVWSQFLTTIATR